MTEQALISVVIPTYNRAARTLAAVKSVLSQTYKNIEIVVVDDASADNTLEVLKQVEDPRLRVIALGQNRGGGVARNTGIDNAKGEFVAFLDSDDEWSKSKLEIQLSALLTSSDDRTISFTNLIIDDGRTQTLLNNMPLQPDQKIGDYIFLNWSQAHVQTSSWLMPTGIARAVRFRDDLRIHQDWDFLIRAQRRGYRFLHVPQHLTIWRVDDRPDRVSLSPERLDRSLAWLDTVRGDIGNNAYRAFLARQAPAFARLGAYRSIKWITIAAISGAVSPRTALRLFNQVRGAIAKASTKPVISK
ncbi:glycosyltransferase involved in cell wall biosynthesis [Rhizobium sp. BK529]|uniref:glycosyltransferase family 2 protein n=1 Tax=unclassified Rhizobium TaxID=2613769 RepID=UPI0010DB58BF|nr:MULTISPECIES: glycosyltransferase family 2 protein [unclassified Rhizobium]MBB3595714.1 glycosyltransferase involved in cell wall biosynthesis [Rhizobium sp. BK529]TCR98267.1 glycosyltransferase involved in cell wall biosynthesis [Rhizobium sp. BK418]